MNIKLTEYIGASTIALSVKDVPMTALPGIKDAFVRLCETVEAHRGGPQVYTVVDTGEKLTIDWPREKTAGEVMQPIQQVVAEKLDRKSVV